MAEANPLRWLRITVARVDMGSQEGTNRIQQVVGGGTTIPLNCESPLENVIALNDSQIAGLFGYIGLMDAGIDTTAIESAISTIVSAS